MRDAIWVSGAGGFVGRRLLPHLAATGRPVVALLRTPPAEPLPDGVTVVRGDLLDPGTYLSSLQGCSTVVHLAASTGKAAASEHERVNGLGTERLVDAAIRAGVGRFVFVSTIATTFPDLADYPYARAKVRAEAAVRASGLPHVILRPTIILGDDAPLLGALGKLAMLPVVVMPGDGRVQVQPIHVDDVCRAIVVSLDLASRNGEAIEIGGPDTLTMEALLQRLRVARGGSAGPVLHVPLVAMRLPLRLAERAGLGAVLPVTAGQLTAFRFDSRAASNTVQEQLSGTMKGVGEMLGASPTAASRDAAADEECRVFTRHVVGAEPDPQVLSTYREAIRTVTALQAADRFDEALLAFAARGTAWAALADGYAALLHPASALRKRLVLLLAILESRAPYHRTIDDSLGPTVPMLGRLLVTGIGGVLCAVAGLAIFVPARLILGGRRAGA
ncbi:MAG: SDR family oxidoreductase [Vicinamibacterales bacterium]